MSPKHLAAMLSSRELAGECWLYTKTRDKDGYGVININDDNLRVHRLACEWLRGEPITPERPMVLHSCDNPSCFNPDHLRTGTHADNVADRIARGRQQSARGESHPMAKLRDADVAEIRRRVAAGEPRKSVARAFGVRVGTVSKYMSGHRRA